MTNPTPARALERALLDDLGDPLRQHGLVFWLDKFGHYTALVDRLVEEGRGAPDGGPLGCPIIAFRGSYLETMLALEPYGSELHPERVLVHLPGHDETSVRKTPLLELYELGFRYRKALGTLVEQTATGVLTPAEVRELAARPDLTLDLAEAALAERLGRRSDGFDTTLERMGVAQVVESVIGTGALVLSVALPADFAALRAYLHRHTGFDAAWAETVVRTGGGGDAGAQREQLRLQLGAWLLLLEFVHDLERAPRTPTLVALRAVPKELARRCHELVVRLRAGHAEAYARLAGELEMTVDDEARDVRAEDLGRIDTFAFEERIVLDGALAALRAGQWQRVLTWARDRAGEASFWLSRDRHRRWAWMLAQEAAALGGAIEAAPRPLAQVTTLDAAVERYRSDAFRVDRAHRLFEQRWHELRDPQLPHWDDFLEIVELVRRSYRAWADELARDFTAICAREGFLPDAALQQRTLFDQVVRPLAQEPEPVALFVIDALRFELAEALAEELRQERGVVVDLRARLAELPTLTAVGMNALAPVSRDGRLDAVLTQAGAIRGFKTGGFAVIDPATRARAMGERAIGEGARLVKLDEVTDAPTRKLNEWAKKAPRLLVVHGLELDDAGEAGFGLATFEHTLRQVRAAWHRLSSAGFRTCVFTADHGFLLQDATTTVQAYGKKTDPSRRHVWHAEEVREDGLVPVSLAKLGYDHAPGYLLLRADTAVYATSGSGATFVHGGNSLEERVIPVLVVKRRHGPGQSSSAYVVEAQAQGALMGVQRVKLRVQLGNEVSGNLGFAAAPTIRLELVVRERPDVKVRLRDCAGPARLRSGVLEVQVGAEWTEAAFVLEGPEDDRVRLEIRHPDRTETVQSAVVKEYFAVTGKATATTAAPPRHEPPPAVASVAAAIAAPPPAQPGGLAWQDTIEDEEFRKVFEHIGKHGSLSEAELQSLLGSRKSRAFAREFEGLIAKLPFRVRIDVQGNAQKLYVKEGGH